jgi:thioredoxin-like negative regulator of GroEL
MVEMESNRERTLAKKNAGSWDSTGLEVLRTSDFDGTHLKRPGVYAVCFGATWCPPTRGFVPKFVARNGKVPATLAMADITEWEDPLWDIFRIEITPTIAIFRDGELVTRFDGRHVIGLRESDLDKLATALNALNSASAAEQSTSPA